MTDRYRIIDYPKTKCIYEREMIGDRYLVAPRVMEGMEWVFDDGVKAVDKLHGSNHCVHISDGVVVAVDNRGTRIITTPAINTSMDKGVARVVAGVLNSIERGWFRNLGDGRHYGELIGPNINGNLHKVDRSYFVPFDYLCRHCHWRSWISNKYPKTFDSLSEWFKELPSLFSQRVLKEQVVAEGLVFWHPDGRRAKLRRDMFEWYEA